MQNTSKQVGIWNKLHLKCNNSSVEEAACSGSGSRSSSCFCDWKITDQCQLGSCLIVIMHRVVPWDSSSHLGWCKEITNFCVILHSMSVRICNNHTRVTMTHGGDSRTALYIFDTKSHTKLPLTAWKRPKPNCMQLWLYICCEIVTKSIGEFGYKTVTY